MKVIRVFTAFVVVSLVIGLGSAFSQKPKKESLSNPNIELNIAEKEEINYPEVIDEEIKLEDNEFEEQNISSKTDEKIEIKETKTFKTDEKKQENIDKQSIEYSKEEKNSNSNPIEETKTEEVIEDNKTSQKENTPIWEELGISEDDYYNKPMMKWQRIDFENMEDCLEYGKSYKPYIDGEELFNCRKVVSYSGNFLGVMFDTEKLS